ncbi:MAG: RES family NAD+ phosphorylase [Actinobacteria bacterium]|nr:RES family NAD+ phosphorylase [Actinomycetota bacterium]
MNPPRPKVPRTPPTDLVHEPGDILSVQPLLWRIHRTQGSHVLPWNQLRTFGPIPTMRYEPQPEPAAPSIEGGLYTATSLATALAETFQATRIVDSRSFGPRVTAWTPTRALCLLDLTGGWALRNGAAFALATAPKSTCRAWARQIRATWPDLDGLRTPSTMTGGTSVVLWNPARTSLPAAPDFSRPLAEPTVHATASRIAGQELGYRII